MSKLTLWYTVQNGGDGSAYPQFVESEELAEWDQDNMEEGWGESCAGSITVEGDNLTCQDVESKEGYYLNLVFEGLDEEAHNEKTKEFKTKFFPDGLPEFTAKMIDDPQYHDHYYGVFVGDSLVYSKFAYPEKKANAKGLKKFEKLLQAL